MSGYKSAHKAAFVWRLPSLLKNSELRGVTCRWDIVPSGKGPVLQFKTLAAVEVGQEALISYGNKTSWEFLLFYGFVPMGNVHDQVTLWANLEQAVDWLFERLPPQVRAFC